MASTEKISLSLDAGSLLLARRAAEIEGMSLSAWMSALVRRHAWDSQRPALAGEEQAQRDRREVELDEEEAAGWSEQGRRAAG
jgi:hypothetical protein